MKNLFTSLVSLMLIICLNACNNADADNKPNAKAEVKAPEQPVPADAKQYEISCGACIYKKQKIAGSENAKGCPLYVIIDGKSYEVKSTKEPLNAHRLGLCTTKATANLVGKLENGIFRASYCNILHKENEAAGKDHSHAHEEHVHGPDCNH